MNYKSFTIAAGVLFLASQVLAQREAFQGNRLQPVPPVRTVAQLGTCAAGALRIVGIRDGADESDCTVGGGSTGVVCLCANGEWNAVYVGAGGGGSGTVTSVDFAVPAWLAVSGNPITEAGTITISAASGQTSGRVIGTCGAATSFGVCALVDGDIPNNITVDNAATATALAANGANCSSGQFPLGVNASGAAESCSTALAGNADTATALAADGTDCDPGEAARGVDASGNAELCFAPTGGSGDVVGPATATDNALSRYDGTTSSSSRSLCAYFPACMRQSSHS